MTILNARSRLVSFRLTQDELEDLRVACLLKGARNVSDFARNAVLQQADAGAAAEAALLDRLASLESRLSGLEHSLKGTTESLQANADMLRAVLKTLLNRLSEKEAAGPYTAAYSGDHDQNNLQNQAQGA